MAKRPLGRKAVTRWNTAAYSAPSWSIVTSITDATINDESETVKSDVRELVYKETQQTSKDLTVEFTLKARADEAAFIAIEAAYVSGDALDMQFLRAAAVAGTKGIRADMVVTKFEEQEPLGDVLTHAVSLAKADSGRDPERITIAS